ncbi:hypothetical protein HETIRDRAFT_383528, partial [Heterobasidion irregulare TC 32-1]
MNRPFGAVDVSANLKGAVPKTATQKILLALADKGAVKQKAYGKTTFFVANQDSVDAVPSSKLAALEADCGALEDANKALAAQLKTLSAGLAKIRSAPTDDELLRARLAPLRAGTPLVSADELARLDADWVRWRSEWAARKRVFATFWALVSDALTPQDARELAEDLGIEYDTAEHDAVERGALC